MRWIHVSSRDSARTPVQWTDGKYAGFSTAKPWFRVNPNYKRINAAAQEKDPDSILNFYRRCLALRKETETLIWGSYKEYFPRSRKHYVYERSYLGDRYLIVCSFAAKETKERLPADWAKAKKDLVLGNYPFSASDILHPYETRVYHMR